jgi:hypothetical protein
MADEKTGAVPLYGVIIHQCIENGDHDEMRRLAAEAAAHLSEVSAALEKLIAAIDSGYK